MNMISGKNVFKVYWDTMGCAKNLTDSEYALAGLRKAGFALTDDPFEAQILVVNTCGFINDAKQESIERILELAQLKDEGEALLLVVTGCLSERYREELAEAMPEVDVMLGVNEYDGLADVLHDAMQKRLNRKVKKVRLNGSQAEYQGCGRRIQLTPPHTAYLKIAEGCNNRCSFCAIPGIRGPLVSRQAEDLLAEARELKESGVRELCLIAQDTTAYGYDLVGRSLLPDLLRQMDEVGFDMLRVLYAYPENISDELLSVMRDGKTICHYLDIPLQHVSANVLRRMNRRGGREQITELLQKIRSYVPDMAIRTTFMVGFPGETEEDFAELLDFAAEAELDWAGVFRYSQEDDTPAAAMPDQVEEDIKIRRYNQLTAVLADVAAARREAQVGNVMQVMLEGPSLEMPGYFEGRSQYQAPEVDGLVFVANNDGRFTERHIGSMYSVKVTEAVAYDLFAVPVDKTPDKSAEEMQSEGDL